MNRSEITENLSFIVDIFGDSRVSSATGIRLLDPENDEDKMIRVFEDELLAKAFVEAHPRREFLRLHVLKVFIINLGQSEEDLTKLAVFLHPNSGKPMGVKMANENILAQALADDAFKEISDATGALLLREVRGGYKTQAELKANPEPQMEEEVAL